MEVSEALHFPQLVLVDETQESYLQRFKTISLLL